MFPSFRDSGPFLGLLPFPTGGGGSLYVVSANAEVTGATEITFNVETSPAAYAGVEWGVDPDYTWSAFSAVLGTAHEIIINAGDGVTAGTTYAWRSYATNDPLDAPGNRVYGTGGTVVVPAAGRSDDFTRANSTTTINPPSDGGSNWEIGNGTWGISTNTGYLVTGPAQCTIAMESSLANVDIQVTMSTMGTDVGLVARWLDNSNYILLAVQPTGMRLWKVEAGAFSSLANTTGLTIVNGDVIVLRADASNNFTGYQNGVSRVTASNAFGSTRTKHGIRSSGDVATRFDDFSIVEYP